MPADKSSAPDADEGAAQLDQMRAAVADEVANLLARLPDDAGLLELTMAEGIDPAGLEQILASLPDTEELAALAASLNDPDALARLLATRDASADPPDGTE
jgi:hypothetical protein